MKLNFSCPICDNSDINSIAHVGGAWDRIYLKCLKCATDYSIPAHPSNEDEWLISYDLLEAADN